MRPYYPASTSIPAPAPTGNKDYGYVTAFNVLPQLLGGAHLLEVDLDGPMTLMTFQDELRQACPRHTAKSLSTDSNPSLRVTDFGVLLSNSAPIAYRADQSELPPKRFESGQGYVTFVPLTWQSFFLTSNAPLR